MIRLEEKYEMAVQFRKRGFTYSEIAKIVDVSKSTVSNWLSKKAFSKKVKEDNLKRTAKDNMKRIGLINKARSSERKTRYLEAEHSAITEYKHYKKDPLFIAGLMLYVGIGDKTTPHLLRITTANMDSHRIFITFALSYLGVTKEQLRFWLHLYPDMFEKKCVGTWSKYLGLQKENFHKNQVIEGNSKKQPLQHGVGNTIIGGTVLKLKLTKWTELALLEF